MYIHICVYVVGPALFSKRRQTTTAASRLPTVFLLDCDLWVRVVSSGAGLFDPAHVARIRIARYNLQNLRNSIIARIHQIGFMWRVPVSRDSRGCIQIMPNICDGNWG